MKTKFLNISQFAKFIGVSVTSVRNAIDSGRLSKKSYSVTIGKTGRKSYKINSTLAKAEWLDSTRECGNNKTLLQRLKDKSEKVSKPKNSTHSIEIEGVEISDKMKNFVFPSVAESKTRAEFFTSELKRIQLEKECKDLISFDLTAKIFSKILVNIQKEIRQSYSKIKILTNKETSDKVKNIIDPILEKISELKKEDFEDV